MRLLRDDLILVPASAGDDGSLVKDPLTGKELELGDVELFLMGYMREPYSVSQLVVELRERFDMERSEADLRQFVAMLDSLGWMRDEERGSDSDPEPSEPQPPAGWAPGSKDGRSGGSAFATAGADQQNGSKGGWHLFDPTPALDSLVVWLRPLRFLVQLIPVFVLIAVFGLWFNSSALGKDFWSIRAEFGLLGRLAFAGLTVNLASQIFQGTVARFYGAAVPSFSLGLAFGLLPRFRVTIKPGPDLSRGGKMAITATSILVRLALFAFGTNLWVMTRASGTLLPDTAAMLAIVSGIGLLLGANPLVKGDGYRLLCLYLEMPNLRERAYRELKRMLRRRPEVIVRHVKDTLALRMYALASILFVGLLLGLVVFIAATRLEASFQGAGVVLFLVLAGYLVWRYLDRAGARAAAGPAGGRGTTRGERPAAGVGAGPGAEVPPRSKRRRTTKRRVPAERLVRYLLLAGVLILLFLPYRYETGGAAEILPLAMRQIYAEQPGVIDQVFFEGGEWVEQGSVLAQMARHRQSKDFRTTEVSIEKQRATIARLETTPSQEELELQKELLKTARLQYAFSAAQAARLKTLYESGGISFDTYDDAVEEMEVEEQRVSEREANLAAVEGQISPYELAAARAEEQRLTEELVYFKERLHRTALHMPIDGRIITMRLKDLQNKFLDDGDLFAEVEDARQVRIKIAVPEADMGEVSEGDAVRLKLWAYPDRFFHSDVSRIYPATAEAEYGTIVEVESLLDNAEGLLRSGMTGHAKIEGREMFVIQAFTRALVRFVLIEVWSWLP